MVLHHSSPNPVASQVTCRRGWHALFAVAISGRGIKERIWPLDARIADERLVAPVIGSALLFEYAARKQRPAAAGQEG